MTAGMLTALAEHLRAEERAENTIQKYVRYAGEFLAWLKGRAVSKETAVAWKEALQGERLAPATINAKITSVNAFFKFAGWDECRVRTLRLQRQVFRDPGRDLTGADCLDLGSGSGILSITALALGASHALGVDIDPKARDAGRENGQRNGFSAPRLEFLTGNVVEDPALRQRLAGKKWDLVLVNIVADVIIALAPLLPELLAEGATVICSGILDSRLDQVEAALTQAGLAVTERRAKEEWRCLTAGRRNE